MRQGCPVSPFIIYPTSRTISMCYTKNNNIKGIHLPLSDPEVQETSEAKNNAYVDDSQFFVTTEGSIVEFFKVLTILKNLRELK